MEHERPHEEQDARAASRVFNLDVLDDQQIAALNQALYDRDLPECDALQRALSDEISAYAGRDPQRVKDMMQQCTRSKHAGDRYLAALAIPSLFDHDYAFVRDALIFLYVDEDRNAPPHSGVYSEEAGRAITNLANNRLSPEQVADFRTRLGFFYLPLPG